MKIVKLPLLMFRYLCSRQSTMASMSLQDIDHDSYPGQVEFSYDETNTEVERNLQRVYHDFHDSDWKGWF